ncbi:MAG: hypothetical protein FWG11_02565 [Promicromonosporaceae bacterium]|nr:hypothetical protein [Promicromonosporaceae bacterium]
MKAPLRRTLAALGTTVLLATLVACDDGGEATAPTPDAPAAEPTESPEPDEGEADVEQPEEPADSPTEAPAEEEEPSEPATGGQWWEGEILVRDATGLNTRRLDNVSTGRHEGFDRIVFNVDEGDGAGIGWWVGYVDAAYDDGSGLPVDVEGDFIFMVRLSGFRLPEDTDPPVTSGSGGGEWLTGVMTPGGIINQVLLRGIFEGNVTFFLGINGDTPPEFSIYSLEDPARVVIDFEP